jgi:hypothetical protein
LIEIASTAEFLPEQDSSPGQTGARGSFVNTDPLRQLLLVLVNRIEEVTTEYSQAFALQRFSATISE